MKVALDYTTGIYPGAGIARYTRSLVSALAEIDSENSYALFYAARGLPRDTPEWRQAQKLFAEHGRLHPVAVPLSVRQMFAVWQRLRIPLPVDLFTGKCDIMHSPDFVSPPHRTGADVVTVHDLSFLVMPECAEPKLASFLGKTVPAAVRRADHVVAVSQQTADDLTRLLDVPDRKITVAYNGVDKRFRLMAVEALRTMPGRLRSKLPGPGAKIILHVGTLEPRKNLVRLVQAYGLVTSEKRVSGEVVLLLAGRKGWLYEPILEAAERVRRSGGNVVFLDYVYDEDLPLLYNKASVFAYPSLYEGFGLPAAEALACGVPTLVSKDGALAEVVGSAALSVEARSVEDIAAGLERLLLDDALRQRLAVEGPEQASKFTWEAAARTVLSVYSTAAAGI
ncbi:MAG: glycosyltransferase family 4 protein [Chloroflexota bacterium]|nr:glycosyltransferase family 4 protein [Chloroflexota bacterium]